MNCKGQFSIIAALLVAVILISTVIITYSKILNRTTDSQPQVISAIDETNSAITQILSFSVGYYGSVIKVTGDVNYARERTVNYTSSGLQYIARMHPDWGAGFSLTDLSMQTYWYDKTSYSTGNMDVAYNLTKLGISGMRYKTSCELRVQVTNVTADGQAYLNVAKDDDEPLIDLRKRNFRFYHYDSVNSTWDLADPTGEPVAHANGTYQVGIPPEVDPNAYVIQVEDQRGLIVVVSSSSRYTYSLNWSSVYANSTMLDSTMVVELMQNGTMRWLGQNLTLATQQIPIPPIPAKAIRVNQTINGIDQEVNFQIEDWASNYRIPLGLTSNASILNSQTMLVFLVNANVSKTTVWWDGRDTANQTSYAALTDKGFNVSLGTNTITLNNGKLVMKVDWSGDPLIVNSTVGSQTATAVLFRIGKNGTARNASPSWPIVNGTIRAVVQGEVEWGSNSTYQIPDCPNVYAHLILTIPANVTYYTYQLRLMFAKSNKDRNITDVCPISLKTSISQMQVQTENGTGLDGYPIVSNATSLFRNNSVPWTPHHWSQFVSGAKGAGIMFTDSANQWLYVFDIKTNKTTGALKANLTEKRIELLPVSPLASAGNFTDYLDATWHGAIATFDGTAPVYNNSSKKGLWIIVEYPPTVTVTTEN